LLRLASVVAAWSLSNRGVSVAGMSIAQSGEKTVVFQWPKRRAIKCRERSIVTSGLREPGFSAGGQARVAKLELTMSGRDDRAIEGQAASIVSLTKRFKEIVLPHSTWTPASCGRSLDYF